MPLTESMLTRRPFGSMEVSQENVQNMCNSLKNTLVRPQNEFETYTSVLDMTFDYL